MGLLPAGGRGVRFGAAGYAKELFPLLFQSAGAPEPRPIAQLALGAMEDAGAERAVVVVSPEKLEVVRVLGAGTARMTLAYVVQPEPGGIPQVISCAAPWLEDRDVVFAMPDTIFLPSDALARVHHARVATAADVMLGVFPTEEPERLGPVETRDDGTVERVHDKPAVAPCANTWGVAAWSPRFTAFCRRWEQGRPKDAEGVLGHAFEAARAGGLVVKALTFAEGRFLDVGTPLGLRAALVELVNHGVIVPQQAATARRG